MVYSDLVFWLVPGRKLLIMSKLLILTMSGVELYEVEWTRIQNDENEHRAVQHNHNFLSDYNCKIILLEVVVVKTLMVWSICQYFEL